MKKFKIVSVIMVLVMTLALVLGLTACSGKTVVPKSNEKEAVAALVDTEISTFAANNDYPSNNNRFINNSKPQLANFTNVQFTQVKPQPTNDEGQEGTPTFTDCYITGGYFTDLFENATIYFYGVNKLYNCVFLPTQTVVIDGDCEFYNCSGLRLKLADTNTYNIIADGSELTLKDFTASQTLNLRMQGGIFNLPNLNLYGAIYAKCNGTVINVPTTLGQYTGVQAVGCYIKAIDNVIFDKVHDSTIELTGTATKTAYIGIDMGGVGYGTYIGNQILTADHKDKVIFGGMICTNNWINGFNSAHTAYVTMQKGSGCLVCSGNTNQESVL